MKVTKSASKKKSVKTVLKTKKTKKTLHHHLNRGLLAATALLFIVTLAGALTVVTRRLHTANNEIADYDKVVLQEAQLLASVSSNNSPAYGSIIGSYNAMLNKSVADPAQYQGVIVKAIAKYYDSNVSEFSDWKVLAIYDPSTDAKPNQRWHALVYAPAGSKPASFVDIIRGDDGAWTFDQNDN